MSSVSAFAIFFIVWWMVLFAILPFGLKTQDEEEDVTLGTVSSAPRGPHMLRAVIVRTTIVSARHSSAGFYGCVDRRDWLGLSVDDIPRDRAATSKLTLASSTAANCGKSLIAQKKCKAQGLAIKRVRSVSGFRRQRITAPRSHPPKTLTA